MEPKKIPTLCSVQIVLQGDLACVRTEDNVDSNRENISLISPHMIQTLFRKYLIFDLGSF